MKTSSLTKGGLLTGISFILVYLSTIIPANKIFILILASSIVPLGIMISNIKTGLLIYISTSILSILLIGFKFQVFLYIICFGCYGLIKLIIERLHKLPFEIILKLLFFNGCVFVSYLIYKTLLLNNINISKLPFSPNMVIPIALVILQVFFLAYDYAVTLFITSLSKRLKKM